MDTLNISVIPGDKSLSLDDSRDDISGDDADDRSEENLDDTPSVLDASQNSVKQPDAYSPWVKSLNVIYQSTKPHKNVLIEGDDLHFKLRCLENHERESRDYSGSVPNYVVANIGFVISDRVHKGTEGHHGRRFVHFPVKFGDKTFTQVNDVYVFDEKTDDGITRRSSEFKADLITESLGVRKKAIERDYKASGPSFLTSYHHSERALWKSLKQSQVLDSIFAELEKALDKGGKVYCMVLDLHSTRYMCHNCEPSSFFVQQKLKAEFEKRCLEKYKISKNGFFLFSRVSAEVNSRRSLREDSDHVQQSTETVQEMRDKNLNVVLQRDDRTTKSYKKIMEAHGFFVSSDADRINTPRPFYVSQRMDTVSSRAELTKQNSSFSQFTKGDNKKVATLIKKIEKLRMAKKFEDALKCVEEAHQIAPENPYLVTFYSVLYIDAEKFIDALPFAVKAHQLYFKIQQESPSEENQKNVIVCQNNLSQLRQRLLLSIHDLLRAEKWDDALKLIQKLLDIDEKWEELYFLSVQPSVAKGLFEEVLVLLDKVAKGVQFSQSGRNKALAMATDMRKKMEQAKAMVDGADLKSPRSSGH